MKKNLLESINNAINGGTAVYGFPSSASDPNPRDFTKQDALNHINSILSTISNSPVINPYSALNRVKNTLYIYGLGFDAIHHEFSEESGNFSIRLTQFNGPYGATNQGTIRQDNGTKVDLDLSVRWSKTNGLYFISTQVVPGKKEKSSVIGENKKKDKLNEASLWGHFGFIHGKGKTHDGTEGDDTHQDVLKKHGLQGKHLDDNSKAFKKGWVKHLTTHKGHSTFEHDATHHGKEKLYHAALDNLHHHIKTAPHVTRSVELNLKDHNGVEDYSHHDNPKSALRHLNTLRKGSVSEEMDPVRDYGTRTSFLGKLKGAVRDYNKRRKQRSAEIDKAYKDSMSPALRVHYGGSMVKECNDNKKLLLGDKKVKTEDYNKTTSVLKHHDYEQKGKTTSLDGSPMDIWRHKEHMKPLVMVKKKEGNWYSGEMRTGKNANKLHKHLSTPTEDFSLKPKSDDDLSKRKVNTPGYKSATRAVGSKTYIPYSRIQLRNLGMSKSSIQFDNELAKERYKNNLKRTKNMGPGDPKGIGEDFSLKPKSATDLEKRKVNNVDPSGGGHSRLFSLMPPKPEHYKRSGKSSGTYKTVTSWNKKPNTSINKLDYELTKSKYKDELKNKGVNVKEGSLLDKIKSIGKSKESDTSNRPNIMKYDRYNDFDPKEVPLFKSSLPEPKKTNEN